MNRVRNRVVRRDRDDCKRDGEAPAFRKLIASSLTARSPIVNPCSEKGLENHSVIRRLFETAKRQGKKPHSFFLGLFTKDTPDAQAALYRKPLINSDRNPVLRC